MGEGEFFFCNEGKEQSEMVVQVGLYGWQGKVKLDRFSFFFKSFKLIIRNNFFVYLIKSKSFYMSIQKIKNEIYCVEFKIIQNFEDNLKFISVIDFEIYVLKVL